MIGVKANIRVAGQAWTAGIGGWASRIAAEDAEVVRRLRAAGATILSRLAMDEGALGAATDNPHFGRAGNPAWPGHSTGGSSGGSAAAVAAGAADAALGTDTLGSVRIPAAYCGVFGLKLGPDAVPMEGVFPLAPSLDSLGILAAEPEMLGRVLEIVAPGLPEHSGWQGWLAPAPEVLTGCHLSVRAFYDRCHAVLGDLMGPPGDAPPLDPPGLRADGFVLTTVEAADSLRDAPGTSPGLARLLEYGRGVSPGRLVALRERLAGERAALAGALANNAVLLLPTIAEPAFAHGDRPPLGQADFTAPANIAGCPAIAIPAPGASPPVSVQLIGPPGSERGLLALAGRLAAAL